MALITTLIFGIGHGFNIDHHTMDFAWLPFAYATIVGGWLAWLQLRTRSLASLIVTHNVANVVSFLVNALPERRPQAELALIAPNNCHVCFRTVG